MRCFGNSKQASPPVEVKESSREHTNSTCVSTLSHEGPALVTIDSEDEAGEPVQVSTPSIDPSVLLELPPSIREEILAEQRLSETPKHSVTKRAAVDSGGKYPKEKRSRASVAGCSGGIAAY